MDHLIAHNRRAYHDFEILEELEAGIVLTGDEIKAVRAGKVQLQGGFARLTYELGSRDPELVVTNVHIGTLNEPTRTRKLLVKRIEINRLIGKLQQERLTLVPLKLYLKRGYAKLLLGLSKGRKQYDKRERLKQKHRKRELDREFRAS
ncbi:MAG: SsrA-binding protein SmpB [Patescibacteria group bacterium]|jgi:SsrA-binding protein